MLKDEYKVYEDKMKKSIEAVISDFDTVRAGRANASVLNRISVDYYGTPTPIQQIASVGSPDPRTLVITPWDASALKGIEKAIQESDLGINPQNDGKCIRLAFPQLTEERRKDLVKQIHKYTEAGKVAVRNIRRDALENFKKQQKASEITEDEMKIVEKDLQTLAEETREISGHCDGFQANICLNYGGRAEILRAARRCAEAGEDWTEENFGKYLYSAGIPDPELIIRPSGELRLSNFLLWQCAYSEFYFCDTLWPDFTRAELDKAIIAYQKRDRRFGGVK